MGDKWTTSGRSRLKAMQKRKNFPVGPVKNRPKRVAHQQPSRPAGRGRIRGSYSEYADPIFRHGIGILPSDHEPEHKEYSTQRSTRPRIRDANKRRILAHYNPNYDPRTDRIRPSPHEYVHEQIQNRSMDKYSRPPPPVRQTPPEPPNYDPRTDRIRLSPQEYEHERIHDRSMYSRPPPPVRREYFPMESHPNSATFQVNHHYPRGADNIFSRPEVGTNDFDFHTQVSQAERPQNYLHRQVEPSQNQGISRFQRRKNHRDDVFYGQTPGSFQEDIPILPEQQTPFEYQSFPTNTQGISRFQRSNVVSMDSRDDCGFHGGVAGDFMAPPQNVQDASINFLGSDNLSSHGDQFQGLRPIGQDHGIDRFSRLQGTSYSSAPFASFPQAHAPRTPQLAHAPKAYQVQPQERGIDRFKRKPPRAGEATKEEPSSPSLANADMIAPAFQDGSVPPTEQSIPTDQGDSILAIDTSPIRFFNSAIEVDYMNKQPVARPGSPSDEHGGDEKRASDEDGGPFEEDGASDDEDAASLLGMRGRKSLWGSL